MYVLKFAFCTVPFRRFCHYFCIYSTLFIVTHWWLSCFHTLLLLRVWLKSIQYISLHCIKQSFVNITNISEFVKTFSASNFELLETDTSQFPVNPQFFLIYKLANLCTDLVNIRDDNYYKCHVINHSSAPYKLYSTITQPFSFTGEKTSHTNNFYVYHLINRTYNLEQMSNVQNSIIKTITTLRNTIKHTHDTQNSEHFFTRYPNLLPNIWNAIAQLSKTQDKDSPKLPSNFLKSTPKLRLPLSIFRGRRHAGTFQNSENPSRSGILDKIFGIFKKRDVPILTIMRHINTLVSNGNNFVNQTVTEQNNYSQHYTGTIRPFEYKVEVNSDSKFRNFFKNLFGFGKGTCLTASWYTYRQIIYT